MPGVPGVAAEARVLSDARLPAGNDAVEAAFDELEEMPCLGRPHSSKDPRSAKSRVWRIRGFASHLVFNQPIENGIEVVHLLHAARDIDQVLGDGL